MRFREVYLIVLKDATTYGAYGCLGRERWQLAFWQKMAFSVEFLRLLRPYYRQQKWQKNETVGLVLAK